MADESGGASFSTSGDLWGSIIGGVFNTFAAKKSRESVAEANTKNAELQRDFAQHGIQWKVDDAKRAGLHPLYAIGAAGAAASPSFQAFTGGPDYSAMGQNIGRAADAALSEEGRMLRQAQLEVLKSEANKNNAEAAAANSQSMRNWLDGNTSRPLGYDGMGLKADPFWALSADAIPHSNRSSSAGTNAVIQTSRGQVKMKPNEIIQGKGGVTAGTSSAYEEYFWPGLGKVLLPRGDQGSGPAEIASGLPMAMWLDVIKVNSQADPTFFGRLVRKMMGLPYQEGPFDVGGVRKYFRDAELARQRAVETGKPTYPSYSSSWPSGR